MAIEIERKWIIRQLPDAPIVEESITKAIYLATDPYIRIRQKRTVDGETILSTKICIKGPGALSRVEIEHNINPAMFDECVAKLNLAPITKHVYIFTNPVEGMGPIYTSIVEEGTPNEFLYAEVEFSDEKAATIYQFPFPECQAKDATHISSFKMNRVWDALRSQNPEDQMKFRQVVAEFLKQ